ncbi:MAG TPA: hypothetical protein VFD68_05930 [Gemmatimonadales bacterium]|nr:hypothetical protein [Gemmatimonadales bacterium]
MRATDATVVCLLAGLFALACGRSERAGTSAPPADGGLGKGAGAVVSVYMPSRMADRLMGRLQAVAAQHQWVLSVRTDSAALAEVDLIIDDSAGVPVGRVRPGARSAAEAHQMAEVLRR